MSSYVITDCTFMNSTESLDGGALYFKGSSMSIVISECDFAHNSAMNKGGDIHINGTEGKLINTQIYNSQFSHGFAWLLGVNIYVERTVIKIRNSNFFGGKGEYDVANVAARTNCIIDVRQCSFEQSNAQNAYLHIKQNVTLNIEDSRFDDGPISSISSYLRSSDNCTITVLHSYFTKTIGSSSTVVFHLENTVYTAVTDCFFETTSGVLLGIVQASHDSQVDFKNCIFYKVSGFQASGGTHINIRNSRITDCINTFPLDGFIEITDQSYLHISNTDITENILSVQETFIFIKSDSYLELSNCLYSGNTMFDHQVADENTNINIIKCQFINNTIESYTRDVRGLLIAHTCDVTITDCEFLGNRLKNSSTDLIFFAFSAISITGSVFNNNIIPDYQSVPSTLISIYSSNSIYVGSSNFTSNFVTVIFVINFPWRTFESYLLIENSSFIDNYSETIYAYNIYSIIIHRTASHLVDYNAYLNGIFIQGAKTLRIWDSVFNASDWIRQFRIEQGYGTTQLLTLNSSFILLEETLETDAPNFLHEAESMGLIDDATYNLQHEETPYASTLPQSCEEPFGDSCSCYYSLENVANIYNCTSLNTLPYSVPNYTDWLLLNNNNIQNVPIAYSYVHEIRYLDLRDNIIRMIDNSFLADLSNSRTLKWLDIADNNLVSISENVQNLKNVEKIWLAGNPFHCDCPITWMIGWLNNFTRPSGEHVIVDYKELKCYSGEMKGKPIYLLNEVEMGCFPSKWTTGQKLGVGIGSAIVIITFAIILIAITKSREVKFFMFYYLKLDTVPKDDKNENIDNIEYDGFFCYSHKDTKWVSEVFMKNKKKRSRRFDLEKEHGFRLTIHNRDWIAGRTIRANIMDSLEKSRRVIFLLSRNFLKSKWGMEEFMIADCEAVNGRKNFIIIVLKEKIKMKELTKELRTYLRTYTYIDATKNTNKLVKRLRFAMPHTPLRLLKPELFQNEYVTDSEDEYDDTDDSELDDLELDAEFPAMELRNRRGGFYDTEESSYDDNDDDINDDNQAANFNNILEDGTEMNDVIVHAAFDDVSDDTSA